MKRATCNVIGPALAGIAIIVALWVVISGSSERVYANGGGHSHFRYGHYTWVPAGGNTIDFTLQNGWRRNANPCINPSGLGPFPFPCTGPGGLPGVGDVIIEFTGFSQFDPGDGTPPIGSPFGSPSGPLLYVVTSIDPANNWLFGLALDPASLPTIDTTISHTYAAPGTYTAFTASCCRIDATDDVNAHINNSDNVSYRVETIVNVGTGNSSPVSSLPPIVNCPQNALCSFVVPGADPNGDPLRFRLSTSAEASDIRFSGPFTQPGQPDATNGASISSTGLYTWNTTGATLGPTGFNTLYSTQVTIEDLDGGGNVKSKDALDFLIQLVLAEVCGDGIDNDRDGQVDEACNPPGFNSPPTPTCGSTQSVVAGNLLSFTVRASDADAGQTVALNVAGLPVSAAMTPSLPSSGNPVSSTFSWTPTLAQAGSQVVTFTATDDSGLQALCSHTIEVVLAPEMDHFKCYESEGASPKKTVKLEDQFGVEPAVRVRKPKLFCNPVDKNREGISDQTAHLTGYEIEDKHKDNEDHARRVVIKNQFGEQTLTVKEPELLFVPSEKSGVPSALRLDHFKCYEAKGASANATVDLKDHFGEEPTVYVGKPELFCNPVSKNDEGIKNPADHLACYEIEGSERERNVSIKNQFHTQTLEVEDPELLCAPSEKISVVVIEDKDDDEDDDHDRDRNRKKRSKRGHDD